MTKRGNIDIWTYWHPLKLAFHEKMRGAAYSCEKVPYESFTARLGEVLSLRYREGGPKINRFYAQGLRGTVEQYETIPRRLKCIPAKWEQIEDGEY